MNERVPVALHLHQHLVVSVFWILAILIGVLICISLVTYDLEHLFIYAYLLYVYHLFQ